MATIQCKKCGRRIKEKEEVCPHCKNPVSKFRKIKVYYKQIQEKLQNQDKSSTEGMTATEAFISINKEIRKLELADTKLKESKKINHILHLLLSIVTAGIWLIVWFFLIINFDTTDYTKKLEELYELRDEAELKMKMKNS